MQDVLGSNRLLADSAFSESQVLGNRGVEVMTDHQHIDMLIKGIDGVGARRVGRGGQNIRFTHDFQYIGCMATTCALCMEGVNCSSLEGCNGVLYET